MLNCSKDVCKALGIATGKSCCICINIPEGAAYDTEGLPEVTGSQLKSLRLKKIKKNKGNAAESNPGCLYIYISPFTFVPKNP